MVRWLSCLFFFGLYIVTLARGVLTADNAEFQLVSTMLGLAHPPGFPLYTLLAHFFTKLPLPFSPALKVSLFSAVTSTLTLSIVFSIILSIVKSEYNQNMRYSQSAALIGTAALGTATTFWAQSTTANIRSLTALFAALCLYFLVKSAVQINDEGEQAQKNKSFILLFALAFGFGFTHHLSLAFMGLVMILWVAWRDWRSWWQLTVGLAGLLPLIYLPIREPNLRSPTEFINYALGLGFGGDFFYFSTPSQLWLRAGVMWNILTFQFHPLLLVTALVGFLWLLWKRRAIGILLGGTFLIHTIITATYRAPQTVEYMLPAYVPLAICVGVGFWTFVTYVNAMSHVLYFLRGALTFLFIGLIIWQGLVRFPSFWWLRDETVSTGHAKSILENAPQDATVLSNWHWFTSMRYLQAVEGVRPDLGVQFVFPQGETVQEKWETAIASAAPPTITTDFHGGTSPRPLGAAFLYNADPLWPPLNGFVQFEAQLGATIQILGYQLSATEAAVGEEMTITLVWEPREELPAMNLFAHLVDVESGQLFAQDDVPAIMQREGFSVTQLRLTPRLGAVPGTYRILVGGYLVDGTPLLNERSEPRTLLTNLVIRPTVWRPFTRNPVFFGSKNEHGDRLVGYDFDVTLAPRLYLHWRTEDGFYSIVRDTDHATVGRHTMTLQQTQYVPLGQGVVWLGGNGVSGEDFVSVQDFVANRPITRDLRIGVRFVGYQSDGETWAWIDQNDSVPATGAIPTLKWIAGSRISDPHPLKLGEPTFDGQTVAAWLTVYDAFTNRPIPILDERITAQGIGIPLGTNIATRD